MSEPPAQGATTAADPRRWRVLTLLALVQFMVVVDSTVVNIALPTISDSLDLSAVGLAWVVNGYLLTAGALLLLGGRLADLVGRRTIFLAGTALFAVASLTAGLAQNGPMLIVSRFVQGCGEALAAPAALSMVPLLFLDQKERAKAFGIWGGIAGAGATAGVLLSGVITELADWRWVFLINVPIALVPLLLVPRMVREQRSPEATGRIDVPGAVLVTGGVLAVVYGLLHAGDHGWGASATLLPLLGGFAVLALFVIWELRTPNPLLPMRFFANRTRVSANLCTVLVAGSMMAMFFLVVLYMQQILGFSPLQAALAYLPFMVAFGVGLGLSMNLFPKVGARNTITIGFLAAAAGMFLLTRIEADGSYVTQLLPALVVLALGLGMVNPALQNAALHRVSATDSGLASGVQTTVLQLGSALGVSVLVALALQHGAEDGATGPAAAQATVAGFHFAFVVAGVAMVVGAIGAMLAMEARPSAPTPPDASAQSTPDAAPEAGSGTEPRAESEGETVTGTAHDG